MLKNVALFQTMQHSLTVFGQEVQIGCLVASTTSLFGQQIHWIVWTASTIGLFGQQVPLA